MKDFKEFNANKATEYLISWIKDYFNENGPQAKAVIGISGGKDSTVAAALLVRALGAERVVGVLMPNGSQKDIDDSYKVCETLGIESYQINIGPVMDVLTEEIDDRLFEMKDDNDIYYTNAPARLRMTVLYSVAGFVGGRVVNTSNYSERFIGYSTKYGDSAGDFSPFGNYTVREVLAIGECLGVAPELLYKAPEDGMSGKTDEEKIGFSYKALDDYIINGIEPEPEVSEKIKKMHEISAHKRNPMPIAPFFRS